MATRVRVSVEAERAVESEAGLTTALSVEPPAAALAAGVAVRVERYSRSFGDRRVIDHVDLTINDGEIVALLGASGSGKTTLLRALAGLDPHGEGRVVVPTERAVVFQDHRLLPWKRVWRNVILGLPRAARLQAQSALEEVGIAARADAWPATLSGGEAQRVALARAFIRSPRLLLLDEPFGALDALTRLRMHALLVALCRRHNPATLIVTHDVDEAITLADRVLVLTDGRISLDQRLELTGRRARTDPGVAELRDSLLAHLGVEG